MGFIHRGIKIDRRNFILNALTVSVFSLSGGKLLGEIIPKQKKISGEIFYTVPIDEFPDLKNEWGSVRMRVKGIPHFEFPEIIVTRVPFEEYDKHFTCVSSMCTHEGGELFDLDEYHEFECSRHGTLFTVEGDYIVGPASRSLDRWDVYYEGGDTFDIDLPDSLLASVNNADDVSVVATIFPNPCDKESDIKLFLAQYSKLSIDIFDAKGVFIQNIDSGYFEAGDQYISIDTSGFISGMYLVALSVNGKIYKSLKLIVRH